MAIDGGVGDTDRKAVRSVVCSVVAKAVDTKSFAWLGEWLWAVLMGEVYDLAGSSISGKGYAAWVRDQAHSVFIAFYSIL